MCNLNYQQIHTDRRVSLAAASGHIGLYILTQHSYKAQAMCVSCAKRNCDLSCECISNRRPFLAPTGGGVAYMGEYVYIFICVQLYTQMPGCVYLCVSMFV